MAYRIQYTPEDSHRFPQTQNKAIFPWKRLFTLMFILASIVYLKFHGIPDFLIPGDPEITVPAAQAMISDLKAGESLDNALTAFCLEIIHGAQ